MNYRNVGKAGIKVSEIALGSWMTDLRGSAQEDITKQTVRLAYETGINFLDCADAYSGGAAERFLGEILKDYPRKDLVISIKVYFPTGKGANDRGLSRKHIMENCEQSLKNMQVDYLDLYYCHRYDVNTDLEETLRAMSDLGTSLAVMALAWILQHPEISCVIAGASKPSQLENNIKASGLTIPKDAMKKIEEILEFKKLERHVG